MDIDLFKKIGLMEAEFNRLVECLQAAYKGESLETVKGELRKATAASRRRARP